MVEKQWISLHLYYNQPWHELILQVVDPIVHTGLETGLLEKFFFLRYWDRGPHIRLRFYGIKDQLEGLLVPNLKQQFEEYVEYNPSFRNDPTYGPDFSESQKWVENNTLRQESYTPEIYRYGGPEGVKLAEQQFFSSSKLVLEIFRKYGSGWTYEEAMGKAIDMHLCFAHAMRMDITEALKFFHMYSHNWLRSNLARNPSNSNEQKLMVELNKSQVNFQRLFRAQKSQVLPHVQSLWEAMESNAEFEDQHFGEWKAQQTAAAKQMIFLQAEGKLKKRPASFQYHLPNPEGFSPEKLERWMHFADYIHLTNNRLGINNQDEAYLAFMLSECLERML